MISGLSFGGEILLIGTGIVCREQETVRFTARLETARLDDRTNRDAREKHRRKRYGVVGVRVRGHDTTHRQSYKHRQVGDDNDDDDNNKSVTQF